MLQLFSRYGIAESERVRIQQAASQLAPGLKCLEMEYGYYVQLSGRISPEQLRTLFWLLGDAGWASCLRADALEVIEVGPRLNFETAWSTTAVSICHACGLDKVIRVERAVRYGTDCALTDQQVEQFLEPLIDRMTHMRYMAPLTSFDSGLVPATVREIPLMTDGRAALEKISAEMGFGWDEQDVDFIERLFANVLQRNPTDVELFQLAQANSEHSRHHFFRGELVIDGKPLGQSLMDIVKTPWRTRPGNSVIGFKDNSSAIRGGPVTVLADGMPGLPGALQLKDCVRHSTLTAETHNFPSGVAPYPGAATGTGGRIRDNQAVGRGGLVTAAAAGYCTGNIDWSYDWKHPSSLAAPIDILIQASNGASDYGNCFGEPVIYGFCRTFSMGLPDGYRSWFKPVMYSAGVGQVDDEHVEKQEPKRGMYMVQLGGPAYRIGLGGGAASSVVQGDRDEQLDFDAVQRGDPQMEQRMNRVIRACVELGAENPIVSMHDLGAGGCCNAFTEIVEKNGAKILLRMIPVGDQTLSALEIWGNESQERNVLLVYPGRWTLLQQMCERENVPCALVGGVLDTGELIVADDDGSTPVKLPLDEILGNLPKKKFELQRVEPKREPLRLMQNQTVYDHLNRILREVSVGSKRFLTNKVDRSVTGLVVQQQCVGPMHTTLSDYAIVAHSHFDETGTAMSLGEQPIKGLLSPQVMARSAVVEALLNLCGARITRIEDIRCSANWMVAAKLPGEGAWLADAARALRDTCLHLCIAVDGGKDSLSMATRAQAPDGSEQTVKAPGQLVVGMYAPMTDVNVRVTPDLKREGNKLLFIDLSDGSDALGGSALAQWHSQVGNDCPDVADFVLIRSAFRVVQDLVASGAICSLHDRSDGGLITAVLEMAFAGGFGCEIRLTDECSDPIAALFSEGPGLVLECDANAPDVAEQLLRLHGVPYRELGKVSAKGADAVVIHNGNALLHYPMQFLRYAWESRSATIDAKQANPICVNEEMDAWFKELEGPTYALTYTPQCTPDDVLNADDKPKVAILREQGSNGDREMAAAFLAAGFEPWDVTMTDLLAGRIGLDKFRGIAFVGGFSFADVLGAGRGWAGVIQYNPQLNKMFEQFRQRSDTFSLGVCNGCQLMAQLGWVPGFVSSDQRVEFVRNISERFESRFSTVRVTDSPAVMFRGMVGSLLGVWVAHGEGRLDCSDSVLQRVVADNLVAMQYTDPRGAVTGIYPFNPNGSPNSITALCSPDGRHLAMMPHPERTFLLRQWPWLPDDFKRLAASPWLRLFQNAYDWCVETDG